MVDGNEMLLLNEWEEGSTLFVLGLFALRVTKEKVPKTQLLALR